MSKKTSDVHLRSDRVLVVALAVILAAASAAVGAAASNHPRTEQVPLRPSIAEVAKPVVPAQPVAAAAFVPAVTKPAHAATAAERVRWVCAKRCASPAISASIFGLARNHSMRSTRSDMSRATGT